MLTIVAVERFGRLARCEEQRHEGAGDEVDGADVDVEEAVEVFGLGGFDGADVADAGVVDEDVEAGDRATAAAMESGLVTSR